MPRVTKEQIEMDEKKVIAHLMEDASQSINDIAKKCNFSRQKVWRIIKRLEKNKVFWGSTVVVDEEKIGKRGYCILIKKSVYPVTEELAGKIIRRDIEKLAKKLDVMIEDSFYTHGKYDWVLYITAPDIAVAKKFSDSLVKLYETYIADIDVLETLFPIKKSGLINPQRERLREFV